MPRAGRDAGSVGAWSKWRQAARRWSSGTLMTFAAVPATACELAACCERVLYAAAAPLDRPTLGSTAEPVEATSSTTPELSAVQTQAADERASRNSELAD